MLINILNKKTLSKYVFKVVASPNAVFILYFSPNKFKNQLYFWWKDMVKTVLWWARKSSESLKINSKCLLYSLVFEIQPRASKLESSNSGGPMANGHPAKLPSGRLRWTSRSSADLLAERLVSKGDASREGLRPALPGTLLHAHASQVSQTYSFLGLRTIEKMNIFLFKI